MKNNFELSKEQKEKMINEIKKYFLNERDEDLGDLAAMLILDFITENIAHEFYNLGIRDAVSFMNEKVEDLYSLEK